MWPHTTTAAVPPDSCPRAPARTLGGGAEPNQFSLGLAGVGFLVFWQCVCVWMGGGGGGCLQPVVCVVEIENIKPIPARPREKRFGSAPPTQCSSWSSWARIWGHNYSTCMQIFFRGARMEGFCVPVIFLELKLLFL